MAKRNKRVVRRVYEQGREITMSFPKQKTSTEQAKLGHAVKPTGSPIPKKTAEGRKDYLLRPKPSTSVPPQPIFKEHYELPLRYGTTRLTLLVKDPFWIFAYWEIALGSLEAIGKKIGQQAQAAAKVVLRMYDVTLVDFNGSNANSYFDIEVGPHADHWYVNLWRDSVSYLGEIGLRTLEGAFFALARSNAVHTPAVGYSTRSEQIWMEVKDEATSPAFIIPRVRTKPDLKAPKPTESYSGKRKEVVYYLTEAEIRSYYARLGTVLREIIGTNLVKLWGRKERDWFILEGETLQERQAILSHLPREYLLKRLIIGASESLLIGASEQHKPLPGASDFLHEKIKRKFFFELATELIVYGRTEPNAEVWLGDKKIPLRPDGTFSLRFALADGQTPLEFKAISVDGQQKRKIDTYIQRVTHYADEDREKD